MRESKKNRTEFYIRCVLTDRGMEELKVPKKLADKQIDELLKEDKEMLEILAKL